MNPWPFVIAAYGLTLGGAALITFLSWRSMTRAENAVENLPRR
ncbi:MAG: hypothetical protein ABI898_13075 [Sphingomonadales bacterium]